MVTTTLTRSLRRHPNMKPKSASKPSSTRSRSLFRVSDIPIPNDDASSDSAGHTFSSNASNAIQAFCNAGYRLRIVCSGILQPNSQDVPSEVFLKGSSIDSFNVAQNGRFWGLSRRLQDGKQIVDVWALIPPEEARK